MPWNDWIRTVEVEPSLYAADFARLGEQIDTLMRAGVRIFHFDVGDGHFVEPITIGPIVLQSISEQIHRLDGVIDCDARSEARSDKSLWTEREFGDFVLQVDWRIKETPYINPNVYYILPDGTHARDIHGQEMKLALPDSDSGIFLRGSGKYQVNIWCWPIGSGEMYGIRTDAKVPAELRAAATPRTQADKPVGEWNHFEITVRGNTVTVMLNGKSVIPGAQIPGLPARGRIGLQHHGGRREGQWNSPPSLLQFRNIHIKELGK